MKKFITYFLLLTVLWGSQTIFVFAGTAQEIAKAGLDSTNKKVGFVEGDPATTIGSALSVLLSILSLIFLIICVYAGVVWMTAQGEKDSIAKARSMLIQGSLGLAVTLSAYAFTAFVIERIGSAVGG